MQADAIAVQIKLDDLTHPGVIALLAEHIQDMRAISPPCSKHALDLEGLKKPEIAFWSAWDGVELAGCGAMKRLNAEHVELKSMRTVRSRRGQGIGALILGHIMNEARRAGYGRMSLETGSMAFFAPARALYEKHGFKYCGPFAEYRDDPNSVFMTREL